VAAPNHGHMTRNELVGALGRYTRPGSPNYAHHFQGLPAEVTGPGNVLALLSILGDEDLPPKVREHAAGALGEVGDERAVPALLEALAGAKFRRAAAVALGRMRVIEAAEALGALAPKVKAAQWALSQLDLAETPEDIVEDLGTCQLRAIQAKVKGLSPDDAEAVAAEVLSRLEEVVGAECHLSPHRRLVTTLQYLVCEDAGDALTEGLRQYVERGDMCIHARPGREMPCACVPNRLMRALGDIKPLDAVPVLVDLIEKIDSPIHQHQAAVCLGKIASAHGDAGLAALSSERDRLSGALKRLQPLSSECKRTARATEAIGRVLESARE